MNQTAVITVHDDDFVSSIQLQNELGLDSINVDLNTSSGDVESDIYDEHCGHDPGL